LGRFNVAQGLLLCWLSVLSISCASCPDVDKYGRREIDRPFTLPHNVDSWTLGSSLSSFQEYEGSSDREQTLLINPFQWQQSLSDNFNLLWAPIPLGFLYQFHNSPEHRFGVQLATGIGYSSFRGLILSPTLMTPYR
jgi:hypothetical protein